jgi:CPA2 family monovalent cation:H+ antiporter-2
VTIIARARDIAHARELRRVGANEIVLETLEASLEMIEIVMRRSGMAPEEARALVTTRRQKAQEALDEPV